MRRPACGRTGPLSSSASSADSGLAIPSSACCSAFTPNSSSTIPPNAITPAPMKNAIATFDASPVSIIFPKMYGPVMPPTAVPIA